MQNTVLQSLNDAGVQYELLPHSRPVYTTQEASQESNTPPGQGVKTMILQTKSGKLVAALIPGDVRLSRARVRTALGEPASLLTPERVLELTGFTVGAVSPVGLSDSGVRILIDPTLLAQVWVTMSSGDPMASVRLRSSDLMKVIRAEIVELIE